LQLDLRIFAQSKQGPEGLFKLIERSKPYPSSDETLKKRRGIPRKFDRNLDLMI